MEAVRDFLEEVGVPETNINLVEKEGNHAFITEQGGAACGITAKPYVSNCNLAWIYGPLQDAAPEPKGRFIDFDQQAFAAWRRLRRRGRGLCAPCLRGAKGLPSPHRAPWLRSRARRSVTISSRSPASPTSPTPIPFPQP